MCAAGAPPPRGRCAEGSCTALVRIRGERLSFKPQQKLRGRQAVPRAGLGRGLGPAAAGGGRRAANVRFLHGRGNEERFERRQTEVAMRRDRVDPQRGGRREVAFCIRSGGRIDVATLAAGLNFTLQSSVGDLDLFGEVTGIGGYAIVERLSQVMLVYDRDVRVLSLDGLERAKRAAGRLKDLVDLAEIEEIRRLRTER